MTTDSKQTDSQKSITKDNTKFLQNKTLSIILAVSVLLNLGLLGWAISLNMAIDNARGFSEITVDYVAKREVKPDTADISFSIEEKGENVEQLNQLVDEKGANVIKILTDLGVSQNDIQSTKQSYNSYDFNLPETNRQIPAVSLRISFKLKDLQKFEITDEEIQNPTNSSNDSTLGKLFAAGVTNLENFNYTVSNKDEICSELEIEALNGARKKLEDQVKAIGGKKVEKTKVVVTPQCGNNFDYPVYPYNTYQRTGGDTAIPSECGSVSDSESKTNFSPTLTTQTQTIESRVTIIGEYRQD